MRHQWNFHPACYPERRTKSEVEESVPPTQYANQGGTALILTPLDHPRAAFIIPCHSEERCDEESPANRYFGDPSPAAQDDTMDI